MPISKSVRLFYDQEPAAHKQTKLDLPKRILKVIPKAEEVVSYGLPEFKMNGTVIAEIMATKNHVGLLPTAAQYSKPFPKRRTKNQTTHSTVHTQPLKVFEGGDARLVLVRMASDFCGGELRDLHDDPLLLQGYI
jgi:uncharacterized protein YdhG (YjbR/CyaY superfamily)